MLIIAWLKASFCLVSLFNKVNNEGWGAKTLERLARDLKEGFPDVSGFSVRNLQYMKKFAVSYAKRIAQQLLRKFRGVIT